MLLIVLSNVRNEGTHSKTTTLRVDGKTRPRYATNNKHNVTSLTFIRNERTR
jgi:hypothetical protein